MGGTSVSRAGAADLTGPILQTALGCSALAPPPTPPTSPPPCSRVGAGQDEGTHPQGLDDQVTSFQLAFHDTQQREQLRLAQVIHVELVFLGGKKQERNGEKQFSDFTEVKKTKFSSHEKPLSCKGNPFNAIKYLTFA